MSGIRSSFDFSALGAFLNAQAQSRAQQRPVTRTEPQAILPEGVREPWEAAPAGQRRSASTRLSQALATKNFVDVDDTAFNKAGVKSDHRKLFALYKGLSALQTLAQRAGDTKTLSGERTGLATRFAAGLDQVKTFLNDKGFDDLTLLYGDRAQAVTAALTIPRPQYQYKGTSVVSGASDQALAGIAGSETFTVKVAKSSGTIDVAVDLSGIAGTKSLDAIITHMNSAMEAAGVVTRFSRATFEGATKTAPKQYGITIQGTLSETISFDAAATPALYVAGTSGTGATQRGTLTKFTDLSGAAPSSEFASKVEPRAGVTDARASATDAAGNVFVVGSATGNLGQGIVQGDQDVYVRKYDSQGALVWSRLLGSSDTADAFALTTDSGGNVVIAGRVRDKLSAKAAGGGGADSFVTKYDTNGVEVFTRQIGSVFADQANALSVGADGSIYVAGQTVGVMGTGAVSAGATDVYVQKLSATGTLEYTRQFGTGGDDRGAALALNASGELVVASVEAGEAVLRKYSAADGSSPELWSLNLGSIGEGAIGGIALNGSDIYISGATDNAALTAGGAAAVAQAHAGASDGFVFKAVDAGASVSSGFVSYLGTAGTDGAGSVVTDGTHIYVAGTTNGVFPGQATTGENKRNAYLAKLDAAGATQWTHQYATIAPEATARGLSVDMSGSSVLDKLGLPRAVTYETSRLVTAQSSVRAGDYFTLQIDEFAPRKIEIKSGDTMRALALRLTAMLGPKGSAEVVRRSGGDALEIAVKDNATLKLTRGSGGFDALEGLGLSPGTIYGKDVKTPLGQDGKPNLKAANVFGLRFDDALGLATETSARRAVSSLNGALEQIRAAYRRLADGPSADDQARQLSGPPSAESLRALARYQTGLFAFGGSNLGQG